MFLFKGYSSSRDTNERFVCFYSKATVAAEIQTHFPFDVKNSMLLERKNVPIFLSKEGRPWESLPLSLRLRLEVAKTWEGTRLPSRFYGNRRRGRPSAGPRRQPAAESTAQGRPGPQGQAERATVWSPRHPDFTVKEPRLWKARAPGAAAAQRGLRDCHRRGLGTR